MNASDSNIATHDDPAWRHRANFIIRASLPEPGRSEQLWVRQIADYRFEVCCIPFFVYDLALGDIVETDVDYTICRVVEPSGRFVFRVWFGDSFFPREDLIKEMTDHGALVERSSLNLIAVDASDKKHAELVAGLLQAHENRKELEFETGRMAK